MQSKQPIYSSNQSNKNIQSTNHSYGGFSIIPIYIFLALWVGYGRALISHYNGWSIFLFAAIAIFLFIFGFIFFALLTEDYNEKITIIYKKFGYVILYSMYVSIFLFGLFALGDAGDSIGNGSAFTALFGENLNYLSEKLSVFSLLLSFTSFVAISVSLVKYKLVNG